MKDVDHLGIIKVTQMALAKITKGHTRPLHVSFDIDALDDLEASTTGTPGKKIEEKLFIFRYLCKFYLSIANARKNLIL